MIDLAFVGCAHIHTPGFIRMTQGRTDVRIKSVWDHDVDRGSKRATELGATFVPDLKALLKDKSIAGVVIAAETDRHKDLVAAAVRAKKKMFVEKPLGMNGKDALAMAKKIDAAGLLFTTGYFMRGQPALLFIREHIRKGTFGKITRVRASNCHGAAMGGWFDGEWRWMADPAVAGCGAFGDLGTHALDILIWLLGEVESVTASINSGTARYPGCDETGEALLKFKNGTLAALAAAWDDVSDPVKFLVSGTEAHAAMINGQLFFTCKSIEGADGKQPWTALPTALPHAYELFLDAVAGKENVPLVTPSEAAYRNVVMDALYKASAQKKWIDVK